MAHLLYRFGPYALDMAREELQRDGQMIHVMPKVFALLAYLIEHRDRLVAKEELLDAIWADTHVAEGSLTRTITNLRQVLGDEAGEPHFIQTVPRRGYRFVGAVDEVETTSGRSPYALIHEHRRWRLRIGTNLLGRTAESTVPITSGAVSRRHAIIEVTATSATIRDLGSKNGTRVAGKQLTGPVPLHVGDEIHLGPLMFHFVASRDSQRTITASLDES